MGCQEARALSRPMVETVFDLADLRTGECRNISRLQQILTDETVGILVGAMFPGLIQVRGIEDRRPH